jgi:hypothetical protein
MAEALSFRFDTFGDLNTASSRLRAWRLGHFLAARGYSVAFNDGHECDVYVCQKVRPFPTLQQQKKRGAFVIYDLDDHLLLEGSEGQGVKADVVAFINAVDVVTVGSCHLLAAVRPYKPQSFVFENPVDIGSSEVGRQHSTELRRIGWFGTAAGLTDLRGIGIHDCVETITRGGDISFDLDTIDETLTQFDLLLLPMKITEWNLAKNANRMIKAVALGVPVLATATPENRRTAEVLGLDKRFLVEAGDDWNAKIEYLKADFADIQETTARARLKALDVYSMERIAEGWLTNVKRRLEGGECSDPLPALQLTNVGQVAFSYRAEFSPLEFGSVIGQHVTLSAADTESDFLEIFDEIWRVLQSLTEEWVALIPEGFRVTSGFAYEVTAELRKHPQNHSLILVQSHGVCSPPDQWGAYDYDSRRAFCQPRDPGVLIARREWLLRQPWRPTDMLSYWTWALVVQALAEKTLRVLDVPVVERRRDPTFVNICREYRNWAKQRQKNWIELPNPDDQWDQLSVDILSQVAERFSKLAASAYPILLIAPSLDKDAQEIIASKDTTIRLMERQLRALYGSTSWRLTAPLRSAIESLAQILRSRNRQ